MPDRPPFAPGASHDSSPRVEVASLAGLRRALEDPGYAAVCFVGPSGQARADLLYALAEALRARCQLVYLRGTALTPGGFWMRVADALDLASGYDARRRVLHLAGDLSRTGQALLLALDDAQALPADTLYALLATARSQPGLLVVLAHGAGDRLAGPLPEDVAVVLSGEAPGALALPPPAVDRSGRRAAPGPGGLTDAASTARAPAPLEATAVADAPPLASDAAAEPAAAVEAAAPIAPPTTLPPPTPSSIAAAPLEERHAEPAASTPATPPWEVPPGSPVRSHRRAVQERRRERRRRLAWGASGLALGLVLAATIDVERWRPLAGRLFRGIADVAPPREPEPPAPVARNAPPDDAAFAPTGDAALGTPEPPTPDVAAPPPDAGPAAAPAPGVEAAAPAPPEAPTPVSPPAVGPAAAAPPASGAVPRPAPPPPPVAVPRVAPPSVAAPSVAVPRVAAPPVAVPRVTSPPVPAPSVAVPRVASPPVPAPSVAVPRVASPPVAAPSAAVPRVASPPVPAPSAAVPRVAPPPVAAPSVAAPRVAPPPAEAPPAPTVPTREPVPAAPPAALAPGGSAPAPGADASPGPGPGAAPSAPLPRPRRRGPLALGTLAIASDEPVRIQIDGQMFGSAPLAGIRLPRGEHRVLAYFPDGSVAQKTIVLDEQDVAVEFRVR